MNVKKFFSNNKVLSVIISIALLIFIVGIVGNNLIKNTIFNWSESTAQRISSIENTASQKINFIQQKLLLRKDQIIIHLKDIDQKRFDLIQEKLTSKDYKDLIISIYDGEELIFWNENFNEQLKDDDTFNYDFGETYFIESGINAHIIVKDTFSVKENNFEIFIAAIVEKQYQLNEDYFTQISLTNDISSQVSSEFNIEYSSSAEKSKDGRKHSFEIKNNKNKKIAIATFLKPSREHAVKELENRITIIQGLLTLFGFLLLGYLMKIELSKRSNRILDLISISLYLIVLRYLLIIFEFPRKLLTSDLLSDKFYFSDFGFGLAHSPIDLFITLALFFIILLFFFKIALSHFKLRRQENSPNKILLFFVFLIGVVFYLLFLRGFGAAIRGFVFDTILRYFQSTSLSFTPPLFVMQINVLLMGLISVVSSAVIILIILSIFKTLYSSKNIKFLLILASLFILGEVIFTFIQANPLLTLPIKFLQIILVLGLVILIINVDLKTITVVILFFIVSSILSITALLYYNTELEKASLKTTASIISRVDDTWYNNLIHETLLNDFSRAEAIKAFSNGNSNYNSSAFKIWSKSKLQRESINSSINYISLSGELLGGFGSIYPQVALDKFIDTNSVFEEIQIFEEAVENESQKLLRGIFPVKDDYAFLGYLDVSILSDLNDFGFSLHPEFISTGKLNEKAILKLDKLIILDYRDEDLKVVYGNLNPTQRMNQEILNTTFSIKNDAWLDIDINGAEYVIYVKRSIINNIDRIIAVALRDKELSIGLFDFFKIFFAHSLILLAIVILYIIISIRNKFIYHFDLRTKLLLVFLIISLFPLILTAFYFRNLTEDKNNDAIYYKLGKRAFSVENYLNDNFGNKLEREFYEKASNDLNLNYTIYRSNRLDYSSHDLLYDVGLMPRIIAPQAYSEIFLNGSQEVLVNESIDEFQFNSFYYKANLLGEDFIIKVSDGFNKIQLPLSGSEVDVFLFGIYSLAVVFIIIFSAIFANQISLPIRKITSATKSVAAGDLSLELKSNAKGELGELVSGFQYMIKELKKNQTILAEIEREEAWKEMAKQVAHEIKNPLTPMKLSVQQLVAAYNDKSDKFDNFFTKVTNTILNQIETLKNIATEFSNFARMPKLKLEKINPIEIVDQSINLFTDENIKILFEHDLDEAVISGDSEQLKRTIINLLRNSIQANATEIKLMLVNTGTQLILSITDNGKGISKDIVEKIFDPNFTTKKDGMGLGLSMARRYLRSTGADISVVASSPDLTKIELIFPV